MSDNHEHHHSVTIDPKELSTGSVLVSADMDEMDSMNIATSRVLLDAKEHDEDTGSLMMVSPVEFVLAGLAKSTLQILKLAIKMQNLDINNVYVAVSQKPENDVIAIIREIIIDGSASDEERDLIKQVAEKCPIQKSLSASISVQTVFA